jgi:hypothetical protein
MYCNLIKPKNRNEEMLSRRMAAMVTNQEKLIKKLQNLNQLNEKIELEFDQAGYGSRPLAKSSFANVTPLLSAYQRLHDQLSRSTTNIVQFVRAVEDNVSRLNQD